MSKENTNPAPSPGNNDQPGQAAGNPSQNDGTQPPASGDNQTPGGENQDSQKTEISFEEYNALKRKAGRWDASLKRSREERRNQRQRSRSDYNVDDNNADPQILDALRDRDDKIDQLSSTNIKLETKDKVRDLLGSEEYKDIPSAIKRAVAKNPLGFATSNAQSVDDAVADIQDYLDDELDSLASNNTPANSGGNQPANNQQGGGEQQTPPGQPPQQQQPGPSQQTPPANASGPSAPDADAYQGTEGLTGSKRSTQILQNILKNKK